MLKSKEGIGNNLMRRRRYYNGPRNKLYRKRLNVNLPTNDNNKVNEFQESKRRNIEVRLALLAGILSLIGFFWTVYQDYKKDKEEIIINSFSPKMSSKVTFQEKILPGRPLLTLEFGLLIANTSDKSISIIDYKLEQVSKSSPKNGFSYPILYSGLNQGFTEAGGKEANMPFILKAGESKLVYIKTGIIVPQDVFSKINAAYKMENGKDISPTLELTYEELEFYTIKAQIDINGNKVEGDASKDTQGKMVFISSISTEVRHPTFEITFKTASGNSFKHKYHEYQSDDIHSI
ncbi:hypothetical protein PDN36_24525 [Bacillus cereus]|nr:hypothetical protein [Bacillus cereus]